MTINRTTIQQSTNSSNIVDLLERILDKGIVIAGDIKVKLVEVEFLTIQIQLVICSVDKAKEIGVDWWNNDRQLAHDEASASRDAALLDSIKQLNYRIESLEQRLEDKSGLAGGSDDLPPDPSAKEPPLS